MKMNSDVPLRSARTGSTLIEVALGVVVLAVLAVGAAALYHQSWGQTSIQRNKRIALVAANAQLELLRASNYEAVHPGYETLNTYYMEWDANDSAWVHTTTDPGATVPINGRDLPMTTTVAYRDTGTDVTESYDYLALQVAVSYRKATPEDQVVLETLMAP